MIKVTVFVLLFIAFAGYSITVYTVGTRTALAPGNPVDVLEGKKIFQEKNCVSCHQIYGLGGYLGTDLTTSWSDTKRGEMYMRSLLAAGSVRMPDFGFNEKQIDQLIAYLKYVDNTARNERQ